MGNRIVDYHQSPEDDLYVLSFIPYFEEGNKIG
jgi:hypothetical protein